MTRSTLFDYSIERTGSPIWRFPSNQNGEIKGFNDAGVSTFDGNTIHSMVRESVQNSLDAALKPGIIPVRIEFELFNLPPSHMPGMQELAYAFKQCRRFAQRGDKAYGFFEQAVTDCSGVIPVLRISDHGTTGLRGAATGDRSSDWSRLVKQSGSSSKNDFSGGSFGIGKYACFACSAMRTVFFSSLDDKGIESSIGVARLTSFEDRGTITSGIGYYSDNTNNNAMLRPLRFPNAFRRKTDDPGTDIYILDCVRTKGLMRTIEHEALSSFLVSIKKGLLELNIGGKIINSHNLGSIVGELNAEDDDEKEIIEHFSLLSDGVEGVYKITLDPAEHEFAYKYRYPKNSATLYLKQGDSLNRAVMMTRSQGMKLFNQKGFSSSIHFTGILMIEGQKMNEDFRDMEAPSHDRWEPERAKDSRRAERCYKDLRRWIKEEVQNAFAHEAEDQIDAFNVGLYLPASRDVETKIRNRTPNRQADKERPLRRKKTTVRKRLVKPTEANENPRVPEFERVDDSDSIKPPTKSSEERTREANPLLDKLKETPIRARAMGTPKAGVYRLKFVVPRKVSRFVLRVYCEGEIGESDLEIRSARVVRGDVNLNMIDNNCISFGECGKGEVVELEMTPRFNRYCMFKVDFYATA